MPSFDVMLEPNFVELRNAVEQTNKEIGTRFDFKGSSAKVELTDEVAAHVVAAAASAGFELPSLADYRREHGPSGVLLGFGGVSDEELTRVLDVVEDSLRRHPPGVS